MATYITLTGTYLLPTGDAASGTVRFTIQPAVTVGADGPMVESGITVTLDPTGAFSVPLLANTDPAVSPSGSYYLVQEAIADATREYPIILPHGLGTPLDLARLGPAVPGPAQAAYVLQSTYAAHVATVASTSVLGHVKVDGTSVTVDGDGTLHSAGGGGGAATGSAIPLVESGSGSAGTASAASHEDHVHPAAGSADPLIVHPWSGTHAIADGTGSPRLIVGGDVADTNPDTSGAVLGNDDPAYSLTGLSAYSGNNAGIYGQSDSYVGVLGSSNSNAGVKGINLSDGRGVDAYSQHGVGAYAYSVTGTGVQATGFPAIEADGAIFIADQSEPPTPTGGIVQWSAAGVWHWKGPDGIVH